MSLIKKLFLSVLLSAVLNLAASSQTYNWKPVRIGGGGYVISVNSHPLVPNLRFMTTDVGNPCRWNHTTQSWEPLMNNFATTYWPAVAGNLAFDPQDATGNILYASVKKGATAAGTILKSTDRGNTWSDLSIPIWLDPNDNGEKVKGERLQVDPLNSNVIYVTTRQPASGSETTNGTYKSINGGTSWTKADTLHGSFIAFDTSAGTTSGVTKNIYIGNVNGVYQSTNGGTSFSLMPGSPAGTTKGILRGNGILYVIKSAGIYKWNGTAWSTITTPFAASGYAGIEVNPNNSDQVIACTGNFTGTMFITANGGTSWTKLTTTRDNSEVPWSPGNGNAGNTISDFAWDPFNSNEVWFSDLVNLYQTTNVWATPSNWKVRAVGHEEVVVTGPLLCPPSGSNLLMSVTADVAGFDHKSITSPPTKEISGDFQYANSTGVHMTGAAFQETNPDFIARVGRRGWSGIGLGGYSTNGGLNYTQWICPANCTGGRIAVSATSETMVWCTQSGYTYRSTDRGQTWNKINSIGLAVLGNYDGSGSIFTVPPEMNPLAADKVNGNKFYIFYLGRIWTSTDGGITFTQQSYSFPNIGSGTGNVAYIKVETTPGKEGDVWVSMEGNGLYHSTNSGANFTKISNVQSAKSMAVGKAATTNPAIYVLGTVNSTPNSLFRSDDNGTTWTVVSNPTINVLTNMAADRNVYGRVFTGVNGNGIYTGEPVQGSVTGVTLDSTSISVPVRGKVKLTAYVLPAWAANKSVTWSSADTAKALVDSTGVVTGKAVGTTLVIVTTLDGNKKDTVNVTVTPFVPVTGVTLSPNPASVGVNDTLKLTAAITPSNATDKRLLWSSSDTTIAKVDSTGLVKGISIGNVVIYAYESSSISKSALGRDSVTVVNIPATGIAISPLTASVGVEDVIQLKADFTPANTSNKTVVWTSSDTAIAKVNANGLVTGRSVGTVTITATATDTSVHGTRTVTVVSKGLCGLMPNNGFESSFVDWFLVGPEVNGNKVATITNVVHSGAKAVLISGNGGVSSSANMLVPGTKEVTFKAWAKVQDFPLYAGFGIDYIDSSNNKLAADQFQVLDTVYKEFSVKRVTPANTARVSVWTYKSGTGGRMYMDDFCVTAVPVTYVTGVTVSPDPSAVAMGYTTQLTATVLPSTASTKTVTWESSNPAVATVNASGLVTGVSLGTAYIIVTTTDGGKKDTSNLTVSAPILVTGVSVTPDTDSVAIGATKALTATVSPANATNKTVTWSSSNTATATVNSTTGVVTGVALGFVNIIGTTQDGAKKDTSVIQVVPAIPVSSIDVNPDSVYIGVADKYTLTATILPANATNKTVNWTSSNTAIATVNSSTGQVTAVAVGTATITGTTVSGSKTSTSKIIVISAGSCGVLTNNGFESSLVNWNNINNAATITTTDVHSGYKAVQVSAEGGLGYGKVVPFTVGDTIVFKAWSKVSGSPVWAGFSADCQNASGTKLATMQFTVTATSYTEYIDTVIVPAGTTLINIWTYKSGAAGSMFLDDFCLSVIHSGSLRRADEITGAISNPVTGTVNVSAYPNPVLNDINLRISNFKGNQVEVMLTDMSGRIVHREKINTIKGRESYKLNTSKKPGTGQYILNVKGQDIRKTIKIIIP